jgi:hypothetical protein
MKPEYQDHEGHRIEIRGSGDTAELLIDNVPIKYGRLPNGKYFLDDYAYDWTDNLMDLARRSISYRGRVAKIKAEQANRTGK